VVEGDFGKGKFEHELPIDDPGLAFIAALVGAINIILLFMLLLVYITSYRKLKSSFSLGLVFFAFLLIMQHIGQNRNLVS
jgi:multisubunit Na+/H+ antiporter MnhB subunit